MSNSKKSSKIFALTLLASLLVVAAINVSIIGAQTTATVNMIDTIGGTTDPVSPGTYTFNDGDSVTFTATPEAVDSNSLGYVFSTWVIETTDGSQSLSDNPLTFPVTAGTTYNIQAVFNPVALAPGSGAIPPSQLPTAAIVVVLSSAGGKTNPTPGTYALANAGSFNLQATADSGWQFDHWVISGPNLSHGGYPFTATPTDNPYNVNHGYGSTFTYQAVFSPIGGGAGATPTPTTGGGGAVGASMTDTIIIVALVVVIVIILIAFGVYAMRKKK